jgi:hypothetical protein
MFLFALQFMEVLQRELDTVEKDKDEFLHEFSAVIVSILWAKPQKYPVHHVKWSNNSVLPCNTINLFGLPLFMPCENFYLSNSMKLQEDYDDIVNGWKAKLTRVSHGEQRWGLFIATK